MDGKVKELHKAGLALMNVLEKDDDSPAVTESLLALGQTIFSYCAKRPVELLVKLEDPEHPELDCKLDLPRSLTEPGFEHSLEASIKSLETFNCEADNQSFDPCQDFRVWSKEFRKLKSSKSPNVDQGTPEKPPLTKKAEEKTPIINGETRTTKETPVLIMKMTDITPVRSSGRKKVVSAKAQDYYAELKGKKQKKEKGEKTSSIMTGIDRQNPKLSLAEPIVIIPRLSMSSLIKNEPCVSVNDEDASSLVAESPQFRQQKKISVQASPVKNKNTKRDQIEASPVKDKNTKRDQVEASPVKDKNTKRDQVEASPVKDKNIKRDQVEASPVKDKNKREQVEATPVKDKNTEQEQAEPEKVFCVLCNSSKALAKDFTCILPDSTFDKKWDLRHHIMDHHMTQQEEGQYTVDCFMCDFQGTSEGKPSFAVTQFLDHARDVHQLPFTVPPKHILAVIDSEDTDLAEGTTSITLGTVETIKEEDLPVSGSSEAEISKMDDTTIDLEVSLQEALDEESDGNNEICLNDQILSSSLAAIESTRKRSATSPILPSKKIKMEQDSLDAEGPRDKMYYCIFCSDDPKELRFDLYSSEPFSEKRVLHQHVMEKHTEESDVGTCFRCPVCLNMITELENKKLSVLLYNHLGKTHKIPFSGYPGQKLMIRKKDYTIDPNLQEPLGAPIMQGDTTHRQAVDQRKYYCIFCSDNPNESSFDLYSSQSYSCRSELCSHLESEHYEDREEGKSLKCPVCLCYLSQMSSSSLALRFLSHLRMSHKIPCSGTSKEVCTIYKKVVNKNDVDNDQKMTVSTPSVKMRMIRKVHRNKKYLEDGNEVVTESMVPKQCVNSYYCVFCVDPSTKISTESVLATERYQRRIDLIDHMENAHSQLHGEYMYLPCPLCDSKHGTWKKGSHPAVRLLNHLKNSHEVYWSQNLDAYERSEEPEDSSDESAKAREVKFNKRQINLRAIAREEQHDTWHCPYCADNEVFCTKLDITQTLNSFDSRIDLSDHVETHVVDEEDKKLLCPICDQVAEFDRPASTRVGIRLLKHMTEVHDLRYSSRLSTLQPPAAYFMEELNNPLSTVAAVGLTKFTTTDPEMWLCVICDDEVQEREFSNRWLLQDHVERTHFKYLTTHIMLACSECNDWTYGSTPAFRRANRFIAFNFVEHCLLSHGRNCIVSGTKKETEGEESSQHEESTRAQCLLCDTGELKTCEEAVEHVYGNHLLVDTQGEEYVQCSLCTATGFWPAHLEKTADNKEMLMGHLVHHMIFQHGRQVPSYWKVHTCYLCGFETVKGDLFHEHGSSMHLLSPEEHLAIPKPRKQKPLPRTKDVYVCKVCGLHFEHSFERRDHMRTHDKDMKKNMILCDFCGKSSACRAEYINHSWTEHKHNVMNLPLVQCDKCGEEMPERILGTHRDKRHKKNFTPRPTVTCKFCNLVLKNRAEYQRHVREKHGETFRCEICNFETDHAGYLPKHMASRHNISSHKCQYCKSIFLTDAALEGHIRRNHPDGLIANFCTLCQKQLSSRLSYENHMFHMHGTNVTKRPIRTCEICSFQAIGKCFMEKHMLSHENVAGYKCKLCNQSFKIQSNYKLHMQTKHQDIRYVCPHCQQQFRSPHILKRHIARKHTNQMRNCKLCTYKTYREDLFERHLKMQHGQGRQEERQIITQLMQVDQEALKRGKPMQVEGIEPQVAEMEDNIYAAAPTMENTSVVEILHLPDPNVDGAEGLETLDIQTEGDTQLQTIVASEELQQIMQGASGASNISILQTKDMQPYDTIIQEEGGEQQYVQVVQDENGEETVVIANYDDVVQGEDGVQYIYVTME